MNIFVAKLNFKTSESELKTLFEQYGTVASVKIIIDYETGKSKGFGFVEMENDDEARTAIQNTNEIEFDGRTIVVKEARPRS